MLEPAIWTNYGDYHDAVTGLRAGLSYSNGGSGTLSFLGKKTSVNTGCFTPGIYRVNPYQVQDGFITSFVEKKYISFDSGTYTSTVKPKLRFRRHYIDNYYLSYMWLTPVLNLPQRDTTRMRQLALQKAYGKLDSGDLELGEAVGEYRQTVNLLLNPLKELRKFLISDRSRNLRLLLALAKNDKRGVSKLLGRTGKASAKTMSETYMELRYGLRPLIYMVQDIVDLVNNSKRAALDTKKIRSKRSRLEYGPYTSYSYRSVAETSEKPSISGNCCTEDFITATASVQYRQLIQNDDVFDTFGLSPRFLPETAWALTFASFVVDWIFSIGPWLATLRIKPHIEILGNSSGITYRRRIGFDSKSNIVLTSKGKSRQVLPEDMLAVTTTAYDRQVNVDLSYLPHFTLGRTLDLYKLIDVLLITWKLLK